MAVRNKVQGVGGGGGRGGGGTSWKWDSRSSVHKLGLSWLVVHDADRIRNEA